MTEGLSPLQRYHRDLASGALLADPAQERVMRQLDDLCSRLLARTAERKTLRARPEADGPSRSAGARALYLGRRWPG